ncbi:hypothetical protein BLA18110_07937 [Burkholderia lata]|uniref:hypothetical protein n=1 Tax=Burkholderia lata (strain ATCC 17760 / DSM 23089 / LMG 22485 / NCIMB 9086 / R18194 / 383) TaxID=482957 RepID=UPI001452DBF9|nr:hypothetical protein [Burkholderia lata]VWD54297.1 hypothetical protein BLA18110_07937 [Burkholderia lata]
MSEKLATTGGFRVARPASKRSRWWIGQRPRLIQAKIERLVDKAVADRLERIELEHRALRPDSTTFATMKDIVKILQVTGDGDVVTHVGETTRPYQPPKPLVGGLFYDLDIAGTTKGRLKVSTVPPAAAASQKKVFKVARIDRTKGQLPEVSVGDAEASGRRKTRALFGLPDDE